MPYNVSKGKNTLDESEILEPMHSCLRELVEYEMQGRGHLLEFTEHDIVAVAMLFSTVCGKKLTHDLIKSTSTPEQMKHMGNVYARLIRDITFGMTKVDVLEHYTKGEDDEKPRRITVS